MIVQRFEQIADELEVLQALDIGSCEGRAGLWAGLSMGFFALIHTLNIARKA